MRTAEAEGTLRFGTDFEEKTWCWLAVIPVLVFDCVALQFREGISSLFLIVRFSLNAGGDINAISSLLLASYP